MSLRYGISFIVFFLLIICNICFAGECLESKEYYLEILAKADVNDVGDRHYNETNEALYCLRSYVTYLVMGYEYFATPGAMRKIEKMTKPYRTKVYEIVPKFLESKVEHVRETAATVLAYYKWPKSFEYLVENKRSSISVKCVLFAVLGDKRAIPIIIKYYWKLERKYKTKPQFSYPDKMNCLNALYHLASPEILSFIDSVIENPKPLKIKKRAEKVKKRILELNPIMIETIPYYKVDLKPKTSISKQPSDIAKELGVEGDVIVEALIDSNGNITEVNIAKSSGNSKLDSAALDLVKKCKFTPAGARKSFPSVRIYRRIKFRFDE